MTESLGPRDMWNDIDVTAINEHYRNNYSKIITQVIGIPEIGDRHPPEQAIGFTGIRIWALFGHWDFGISVIR